jgi:serum/glucocorticoid-regulated kinase 2
MPNLVPPLSPKPQRHHPSSKDKFRTALGLGAVFKDPVFVAPYAQHQRRDVYTRQSADIPRSHKANWKHKADLASVTDRSPLALANLSTSNFSKGDLGTSESFLVLDDMKNIDATHSRQSRRPPVRLDPQDGPWSVSVAETPYDARSYSLYIKSECYPTFFCLNFVSCNVAGACL